MRLLNIALTAAIMMFGLVGIAAFGGTAAGAQEENSDDSGNTQQSTGCRGAEVVDVIGPTDRGLTIGPLRITGEKLRLTYVTTDPDNAGQPFFDVTVLDEGGNEVGGQVIFEAGTVTEIVGGGPGNFTLEARSEDLTYEITVEDCAGGNNPGNGGSSTGGDDRTPIPADQYESEVNDEDAVIDDTISDEPLPNTGGVPLSGLGVFVLILVSAGIAILRPVVSRNP